MVITFHCFSFLRTCIHAFANHCSSNRNAGHCFERSDTDALIYAIMEKVFEYNDTQLAKGIRAIGVRPYAEWTEHYCQAKDK